MNKKRILVTGSTGFIGSNLIKRLQLNDNNIIVKLDKIDDGNKTLVYDISTISEGELYNLGNFDVIYHFASPCSVIEFNRDPVKCTRTTLHGFTNILKLATPSTRVIYPSSGNVYGLATSYNENTTPIPTNLYAVSKLACEDMAKVSELDTLGFRIFAGYGDKEEKKGELSSVVGLFTNDIINRRTPILWGDGSQTRDFIYISDIVDVMVKAMDMKYHPKIVNLGTGVSISFSELIDKITYQLGSSVTPEYKNKPMSYVENTCADTELLKKYFKINPLSIDEGIKRYIQYLGINKQ
jgi:UDP-glucose 4-epimerase